MYMTSSSQFNCSSSIFTLMPEMWTLLVFIALIQTGQSTNCSGDNCDTCPRNCHKCLRSDRCRSCNEGFHLSNNKCRQCREGCLTCKSSDRCTNCKEGYYRSNNKCKRCAVGCSTCYSDRRCTQCERGYILSRERCYPCQTNCLTCTLATISECDSCKLGYYGYGCKLTCPSDCGGKGCCKNDGQCGSTCKEGGISDSGRHRESVTEVATTPATTTPGISLIVSPSVGVTAVSDVVSTQASSLDVSSIVGTTAGVIVCLVGVTIGVILWRRYGRNGGVDTEPKDGGHNPVYDYIDIYPNTETGHPCSTSDMVATDSHVYSVVQNPSDRKPGQPAKTREGIDTVYDVTTKGHAPRLHASQAEVNTYSHISHVSRFRLQCDDNETPYDHVTRENHKHALSDDLYDVAHRMTSQSDISTKNVQPLITNSTTNHKK